MSTTTLIESSPRDTQYDADDLLAGLPPLLTRVPVAGPPVWVFVGFGGVLLLLLVPPLALVVTLMGVMLLAAAGARRARRADRGDRRGAVPARPPSSRSTGCRTSPCRLRASTT